ncbi:hypothetical protein AVEN_242680-1 [Araneus ventricosus]|uniref:Uncharacterized protein n=1 Tax=Araneus ventricosus TaxID=182803 RepID=A0A4Y2LQS9_ARAVE|nr:hypothetical protein AVEN_242680-1 [Araneus ventricosus]
MSGCVIYHHNNPVQWFSRKQNFVALYSTEDEFAAAVLAYAELVSISRLAAELDKNEMTLGKLYLDNQGQLNSEIIMKILTDNCVEEWLYGDQEEEITDDAIIHMNTEEEEIDETEDLNDETDKIISHAEATAALDVALRYIEQNHMLYHITFYL